MIYRVDLASGQVTREALPAAWQQLGGRALTSAIVAAEVPPSAWPLGEKNRLVLAPGLLGGSGASSSGRLSVGAKSPLTGAIKESNTGGRPGQMIARLGIRAIVFGGQGEPGRWQIAHVHERGIDLLPADDLAGRDTYETMGVLLGRFGPKVGILCIGPAGEQRLAAANIAVSDIDGLPTRNAGRGGLGAVMGSMGLKAIVIEPTDTPLQTSADPERLAAARRRFAQALLAHPSTGQSLPRFGTAALVSVINALGGLPTRNFRQGEFEYASRIDGQALYDTIVERGGRPTHPCMPGCVIRCSNTYPGPEGGELTRGFEYESIVLLGSNCGIGDLDTLARLNRRCDELGLDTMEMGVTLGVCMEAGLLPFGDGPGALALLEEVARGTPLGRVLGQGAAVTGRVFGVRRVPQVKGQGMPAYDPRALKGTGLTYATSPMGADHTAGNCLPGSALPDGTKPDPHLRDRQVELSRYLQHLATMFDSLGLCWFTRAPILGDWTLLTDLMEAHCGGTWTRERLLALAGETLRCEREYNRAVGYGPQHDALPDFFQEEPLPPLGLRFDFDPTEVRSVLGDL